MHNFDSLSSQGFWLQRALQKAKAVLAEGIVPLSDDHYLQRFIVEDMEAKIAESEAKDPGLVVGKNLSIISEGLICDLINKGLIFGTGTYAGKTNSYDDYINHVDLITRFTNSPAPLVAIDVTYGTRLEKKFKRIRQEIKTGQLAKTDYGTLVSEPGQHIPKIILGLDLKNLCKLSKLWLEDGDQLEKSELIALLHFQIQRQLDSYEDCAHNSGQLEVASLYSHLISWWGDIYKVSTTESNNFCKDNVANAIISQALLISFASRSC